MNKFVKIGADLVNLDQISRITFVENQSGISDRINIQVGGGVVTVDSAIVGKRHMDAIRNRLVEAMQPEDWDTAATEAPADPLAQAA